MNKNLLVSIILVVLVIFAININKLIGTALILLILLYLIYTNLSLIFLVIANKKYTNKKIDEAMPWYDRAYNFKYCKPYIKIIYTYILLRQGDVEKSEKILRAVMKQKLSQKDKINASLNLSLVLWKKDNLDEAIKLLQDLYDAGIKTTLIYQNLGYYLIVKGNYEEALKFNLEASEYSSTDLSLLDNLAISYYYLKDYDKAMEIYNKLIPNNPSFVTSYYYYAKTLIAQEKYEEALEALKRALNCRFSFISSIPKTVVETEIENTEHLIKEK